MLFISLVPTLSFSASWPTFQRTISRDGYVRETAAPPLTQQWIYDIPGQVLSSPAVAYGKVFIGSRDKKIYCFNAYTGSLVWSYVTGGWVDATPVVSDNKVIVPSRDGYVYALDVLTGGLVWRYATGSKDVGSLAVYGNDVYGVTGSPNQVFYILNLQTGALRRSANLSQFATSTPVMDKNTGSLYVGASNGRYNSWNINMLPQWGDPVQTQGSVSYTTPAMIEGKLFVAPGDDDWSVHAYDPSTGYELWTSTFLSSTANLASSIAASTSAIFVSAGYSAPAVPETLYALDINDGTILWSVPLGDANPYGIASSPALANNVVYIMSPQGELYGVTTSTGGVAAKIALNGRSVTSPAVANGWVYTATLAGRVYGFQAQRAWAVSGPDEFMDTIQGTMSVTGTVQSSSLQSYILEYGSGTAPSYWTLLSSGTQNVSNGTLGAWDTRNLWDGIYTLRLSVQESVPSGFSPQASYVFAVPQVKTASVDPATSTVLSLGDGTEIVFPAGAISASDILGMAYLLAGDYPDTGIPTTAFATNIVRLFRLGSTPHPQFLKPVTVKIPYATVTPRNESNMRIYYYEESQDRWILVNASEVHPQEKRVWAELDHFTMFRVMEYLPNSALLQEAEVYTYPNPAKENIVTFKYRVGNLADIRVKVYDVSGSLVAELQKSGVSAGIVDSLTWDVSGKASGVYLYRLEATSVTGERAAVNKKLAIIH